MHLWFVVQKCFSVTWLLACRRHSHTLWIVGLFFFIWSAGLLRCWAGRICSFIFQGVIVFTSHAGSRSTAGVSELEIRPTQQDGELLFYWSSASSLQTASFRSLPTASLWTELFCSRSPSHTFRQRQRDFCCCCSGIDSAAWHLSAGCRVTFLPQVHRKGTLLCDALKKPEPWNPTPGHWISWLCKRWLKLQFCCFFCLFVCFPRYCKSMSALPSSLFLCLYLTKAQR